MSIANYELITFLQIILSLLNHKKIQVINIFPQAVKPRLFRQHNPCRHNSPRKAVNVFLQTNTHIKIQGFPASQPPPKTTFSADGKSPENLVFKPFFRRLFVFYICHQHHALNVGQEDRMNVFRTVSHRKHIHDSFYTKGKLENVDQNLYLFH